MTETTGTTPTPDETTPQRANRPWMLVAALVAVVAVLAAGLAAFAMGRDDESTDRHRTDRRRPPGLPAVA